MGEEPEKPTRVGYGRPPVEYQFRKGQSGNPTGRPRGAKNKVPPGQGLDFGTQPANRMLMEEAYRTVSIREGEKVIELPVIKAVFRALGVSAMKGNRLAQSTIAELVRGIEDDDRRLHVEHFAMACEYKAGWELEIEHARRLGLPEPTPLPHPDDVIIDTRRAEVRYAGPMTPEEKVRWDRILAWRDEEQELVTFAADLYRRSQKEQPDVRATRLEYWRSAQRRYDRVNDGLPERYQKHLTNRCHITDEPASVLEAATDDGAAEPEKR